MKRHSPSVGLAVGVFILCAGGRFLAMAAGKVLGVAGQVHGPSQVSGPASLGIRQSPRGERLTEPTFGPSGTQDRLNWLAKNRR